MGLFDELTCEIDLGVPACVGAVFQFKDMDWPYMEMYKITSKGALLKVEYSTVDMSDPNAVGLERLRGSAARVDKHWEPCFYNGEIKFYRHGGDESWFEFSAYFIDGKLQILRQTDPVKRAIFPDPDSKGAK